MNVNNNMKFNLSPIRILIIYLMLMMLMFSCSFARFDVLLWLIFVRNFALIFATSYAIYRALLFFKKTSPTRWEHRVITTSILFLLLDPMYPWWVFLLLGVLTEASQRMIRLPTGPLMNPAAFGLLVVSFLGYYPAWMGTSFAPRIPLIEGGISIAMLLTLPLGGYVAYKYKKLPIVGAFLIVFAICYFLFIQSNPFFLIVEGTVAFFALVMLVEPKTSPVLMKEQLIYAISLGILIPLTLKFYFVEPYCGPLIVANSLFNLYRNRNFIRSKFKKNPATPVAAPNLPQPPNTSATIPS